MTSFVGEIRMFGGDFAPNGWLLCDGSLHDVDSYPTLFRLLGTPWGGDGRTTFGVPDLRGRVPVGSSPFPVPGRRLHAHGQKGGEEKVRLTIEMLPRHNHNSLVSGDFANSPNPGGSSIARSGQINAFLAANDLNEQSPRMADACVSDVGKDEPHENMQPYVAINYIINWDGLWPVDK